MDRPVTTQVPADHPVEQGKIEAEGSQDMEKITLICLVSHPKLDPESVSQRLELKPYLIQRAGREVVTPRGRDTGRTYTESKWGYKVDVADIGDLDRRLAELVDRLHESKQFIQEISASGGRVLVFINLPNPGSLAFETTPETLRKLADMGIRFGFEIFR
jgi:Domain of unknown function (DUF4279)